MELPFFLLLLASSCHQHCHHYCVWLLTRAGTRCLGTKFNEALTFRVMQVLCCQHLPKVVNTWVKDAKIKSKSLVTDEIPRVLNCYQTTKGDWLPTATKSKLERQRLVRKKRSFYVDAEWSVRMGELPVSKLISFAKTSPNPAVLSKNKTKVSAQSSCSILKYHPFEPASSC